MHVRHCILGFLADSRFFKIKLCIVLYRASGDSVLLMIDQTRLPSTLMLMESSVYKAFVAEIYWMIHQFRSS